MHQVFVQYTIRAALLARGTYVSLMTVSQCLSNEFCLKSRTPARKPRLTMSMKVGHFGFTKKYDWTVE